MYSRRVPIISPSALFPRSPLCLSKTPSRLPTPSTFLLKNIHSAGLASAWLYRSLSKIVIESEDGPELGLTERHITRIRMDQMWRLTVGSLVILRLTAWFRPVDKAQKLLSCLQPFSSVGTDHRLFRSHPSTTSTRSILFLVNIKLEHFLTCSRLTWP